MLIVVYDVNVLLIVLTLSSVLHTSLHFYSRANANCPTEFFHIPLPTKSATTPAVKPLLWQSPNKSFFISDISTSALNTFAASYLNTQGLNKSCLKSPASTLVDLTFQSRALRSFSLNQLHNLSL